MPLEGLQTAGIGIVLKSGTLVLFCEHGECSCFSYRRACTDRCNYHIYFCVKTFNISLYSITVLLIFQL